MLIQIIIFLLMGIFAGTITGLIPGIHINLIGVILISLSSTIFISLNSIYFIVFIVAMAITHIFVDFIPSIFLGCPDTDTKLSILPGHEMLKKGEGYEAVLLTAYGSLAAIILLIIRAFPSAILITKTYDLIQSIIPYLLILVPIILISLESEKILTTFVFFLTGILGYLVLNSEISEPLLPLLTGLFGGSMLITSIKNKIKIPEQKIPEKIETNLTKPLIGSLLTSPLCSFLPGLGSGQAAVIGNLISKTNKKGFLVLVGATNTLVMGFSFLSLYLISKTRTGAAVAIQKIIGTPSLSILILILIIAFISGIIAFFITTKLTKTFIKRLENVNYTKLSLITLLIRIIITLLASGISGLLVLIISTFTGIYCISLKVRRTNMMGCLLLPVILYYFL